MKLVDFVINLLKTHAGVLLQLSQLLTAEGALECLERAEDESPHESKPLPALEFEPHWLSGALKSAHPETGGAAYKKIKAAVDSFRLPPLLEFHLWAHPFYRVILESPLDLNAELKGTRTADAGVILVNLAKKEAETWLNRLPLETEFKTKVENFYVPLWQEFHETILARLEIPLKRI